MKWIFLLMLTLGFLACTTTETQEVLDCNRMVTCTLVGCDGEFFGSVEVPACDADRFENGCCEPLPEITCNCPR
jgi:hypothetical protein